MSTRNIDYLMPWAGCRHQQSMSLGPYFRRRSSFT